MANEPTIIGALSSGESRSSLHQDPFWQETPRYNRGSLAALMAAIHQVSLSPHVITRSITTSVRRTRPFPNTRTNTKYDDVFRTIGPASCLLQHPPNEAHTLAGCPTTALGPLQGHHPSSNPVAGPPSAMYAHHDGPPSRQSRVPELRQSA